MDDFKSFSNKLKWLNLFFAVTVAAMHCVHIWEMYYGASDSVISQFYICIESKAMTFFFFCSGFWLFFNYLKTSYFQKIEKKLMSIMIPYIAWGLLKIIIVQAWSLINTKQMKYSILDCIKNMLFIQIGDINLSPLNGPLWYLIRIMSYFIIAPIIYLLLKNKVVGIISLLALLSVSSASSYYLFGYWLFTFCFGGYVGLHLSDDIIKMANRSRGIPISVFLLIYCLFEYYIEANYNSFIFVNGFVFDLLIILIVILLCKNPSVEMRHSNYSFILYCSHVIWIPFLVKVIHSILGNSISEGICQSVVLIMCLVITALIYVVLKKFSPKLFGVLVGGRI